MDADVKYQNNDPINDSVQSKDIGQSAEKLVSSEQVDAINSGLIKDSQTERVAVDVHDSLALNSLKTNKLDSESLGSGGSFNVGEFLKNSAKGTGGAESEDTEALDKAVALGSNIFSSARRLGGMYRRRQFKKDRLKNQDKNLENVKSHKHSSSTKTNKSSDSVAKTEQSSVAKGASEGAKKAGEGAAKAGAGAATLGASAVAEGAGKLKQQLIENATAKQDGNENNAGGILGAVGVSAICAPAVPILIVAFVVTIIVAVCTSAFNMNKSVGLLTGVEAEVARSLMNHNFDQVHTAAIMGNMSVESAGICPGRLEGDFTNEYQNLPEQYRGIDKGYGLCQWTNTGRRNPMLEQAEAKGVVHADIDNQVDYLSAESPGQWMDNGIDYGVMFRPWLLWCFEKDLTYLTDAWMAFWERPEQGAAASSKGRRESEASRIYAALMASQGGNEEIVKRAIAEMGKPYVWGAVGPDGYDCSGLVSYCVSGQHTRIGTTETFMNWPRVSGEAQPGCIVTSANHCGIYIGNGQMIHAPQTGDVVKVGNVQSDMIYVMPA